MKATTVIDYIIQWLADEGITDSFGVRGWPSGRIPDKMVTKLRSYRQVTTDQILQARQMTEITLSAFPDPILTFSSDGRITFTNPAANRLQRSLANNGGELPATVLAQGQYTDSSRSALFSLRNSRMKNISTTKRILIT